MDLIARIHENMPVVAADGRQVGFVSRAQGSDGLRLTRQKDGQGFEYLIPLAWVSDVNHRYVFLNRSSAYVAANWQSAPPSHGYNRAA